MKSMLSALCFLASFVATLGAFGSPSEATPIGSFSIGPIQGSANQLETGLFLVFSETGSVSGSEPADLQLFRTRRITAADSGTSLFATSSNEPDFDAFVTQLTNGINEILFVGISNLTLSGNIATGCILGVDCSGTESQRFFGGTSSSVDFSGSDISHIELRYDSFTGSPGSPPTIEATFIVHSVIDIPEPATLALFGIGLLGLVAMRRPSTQAH